MIKLLTQVIYLVNIKAVFEYEQSNSRDLYAEVLQIRFTNAEISEFFLGAFLLFI